MIFYPIILCPFCEKSYRYKHFKLKDFRLHIKKEHEEEINILKEVSK